MTILPSRPRAAMACVTALACFVVAGYAGAAPAPNAAPAAPSASPAANDIYINFSGGVPLSAVVQNIGAFAHKHVLVPDRFPNDKVVNIVTNTNAPVTLEKAMTIFGAALRQSGFVMVEHEDYIEIVPEGQVSGVRAGGQSATRGLGEEGLQRVIVSVKNVDAGKLATMLGGLQSKSGGKVIADSDVNRLIVIQSGEELRATLSLIHDLDTPWGGSVCKMHPLNNTSADTLVTALNTYKANLGKAADPMGQKRLEGLSAFAYSPTNSIILFGNPDDIAKLEQFIETLDVKPTDASQMFHMYACLNRDATELVTVLNSVIGGGKGSRGAGSAAPEMNVTITPDQSSNSLIIMASKDRYEEIKSVIDELDKPKAQVLIEAALVELSTEKLLDLGVEFAQGDPGGTHMRGFSGTSFNLSTVDSAGRTPILPPNGGLVAGLFRKNVLNITALLRLSQQDSDVALIAAPKLMASDNKQASVTLSEDRDYLSQTIGPDGRVNGVTRGGTNSAQTKLVITPHINDARRVRLEIDETTEQFLPSTETAAGPLTNKTSRNAKTEVSVEDGETVVIAGLTGNNETQIESKVPVLGSIPILGNLFKRTESSHQQRNLCIFITPHVMTTAEDLAFESDLARQKMTNLGGKYHLSVPQETLNDLTTRVPQTAPQKGGKEPSKP